jgi:hypothetical protein
MNPDIRWPLGILFTICGLLLTVWGLVSDPEIYRRSLGVNVNLLWGAVLLSGGALTLCVAWVRRNRAGGS